MILIITHKTDFTADFVINKLNQRNIAYKRLNCEDILTEPFTFRFDEKHNYSLLGQDNFDSVWFRRIKLPELNDMSEEEGLYILNEVDSFLKNIFSTLTAKWLSQPDAVYNAENKFLQLKIAQELGFLIPKTIITNSKVELKHFYEDNNKDIIIKPLSQTRIQQKGNPSFIFTNKVPDKLINEIEEYALTPCIFQENIAKSYEIRVTIVGNKLFAASINSQSDEETKIDWRRKKLEFNKTKIPSDLEDLCFRLLKSLNLNFGAIDLIRTPAEKYVFLEINPNGQWAWIETQTGQNISDAIIDFLQNY
jgi:glutathione synthase/RimK-type ligase-like ATP-grasp enzyme